MEWRVDESFYWQQKNLGAFRENEWVVIKGGKVLLEAKNERDVLEVVDRLEGMFFLTQVGHEDDVAELDGVECYEEEEEEEDPGLK